MWLFRIGHRRSCGSQEGQLPQTHLVICADELVPDFQLAILHLADMQDIAVEYLNVLHFKFCLAIDGEDTGVKFLASLFRAEVCAIEEDPEWSFRGELRGAGEELRVVVDGFDSGFDIFELYSI